MVRNPENTSSVDSSVQEGTRRTQATPLSRPVSEGYLVTRADAMPVVVAPCG